MDERIKAKPANLETASEFLGAVVEWATLIAGIAGVALMAVNAAKSASKDGKTSA